MIEGLADIYLNIKLFTCGRSGFGENRRNKEKIGWGGRWVSMAVCPREEILLEVSRQQQDGKLSTKSNRNGDGVVDTT